MTPEMLDFVTYTGVDTSSQQLTDVTANLTGDLFDLPAGPLGFAIGFEHREERGSFTPDPVVAAGETADVPANPTTGGFDVDEYYAEVVVPLLKDVPGAHRLTLSGAIRSSDSDIFSSETGSKLALIWGPIESLTLRASLSEGSALRTSASCSTWVRVSTRTSLIAAPMSSRRMRPTARPWACHRLTFSSTRRYPWTPAATRTWCPRPSDTFTAGFTWDAPVDGWGGLERLLIEANYYDIDIDDAVQAPDAQDLLDGCIDTLEARFCDAVNRISGGTITSIRGRAAEHRRHRNGRHRHQPRSHHGGNRHRCVPLPVADVAAAELRRAVRQPRRWVRPSRSQGIRARLTGSRFRRNQVHAERGLVC